MFARRALAPALRQHARPQARAAAGLPTTTVARRALHSYPVLPTAVDSSSPEFKERAEAMKVLEDELTTLLSKIELGGGDKARARAKKAGKLLVRER